MELKIDKDLEKLIPPLSDDEFKQLKENIKKEGWRENEAIVTWDNTIIDGHNRYKICKKLGIKPKTINKKFKDKNEAKVWIINNQKGRRNLTDGWKWELARSKKDLLLEEGKEKLSEVGKKYGEKHKKQEGLSTIDKGSYKKMKDLSTIDKKEQEEKKVEIPTTEREIEKKNKIDIAPKKHDTRKEISKELGWSQGKVATADIVWKKADEKEKEKIKKGEKSFNQVYQEIKKEEKKKEREQIREKNIKKKAEKMPEGKFNVILADPPWSYKFSETENRKIENQYSTMSLNDIKNMEVPSDDDCILFLWVTSPKLEEGLEVMKSWGFDYKTCAVWDKKVIGMGYYFRQQHELLLIGIKGRMHSPNPKNRISSIIQEKRTEHSSKPEIIYEIIEKMYPHGKYIELFARNKRKNWASWGNELNGAYFKG